MADYDMIFQVDAKAARGAVIDALTTEAGITGWWTDRAKVPERVGETLECTFPGAPMPFDLELTARSDERVEWRTKSFPPPWVGTRVIWQLADNPDGLGTRISMRHAGWAPDAPSIGSVTVGWGQMLANLKGYVETGTPQPFFKN